METPTAQHISGLDVVCGPEAEELLDVRPCEDDASDRPPILLLHEMTTEVFRCKNRREAVDGTDTSVSDVAGGHDDDVDGGGSNRSEAVVDSEGSTPLPSTSAPPAMTSAQDDIPMGTTTAHPPTDASPWKEVV